ncbi:MAG: flagellar biosynthesis protein FlhF, partial [Methylococcales bacterium]|nr:flagellar biosynthesis protein FlhF [Methylococcales bacterium]
MRIKRFVAKDIRVAMRMVKDELGADAVIMSNKSVDQGVEIVAAKDFDEHAVYNKLSSENSPADSSVKVNKKVELSDFEAEKNKLHVVSSSRKVGVDGIIPKRPVNRNIDQYMGYAEKINLASEKNRPVAKYSSGQQQKTTPVKSFNAEVKKDTQQQSAVSEKFMQE